MTDIGELNSSSARSRGRRSDALDALTTRRADNPTR